MTSLKEENEKLKAEIEELKSDNERLQRMFKFSEDRRIKAIKDTRELEKRFRHIVPGIEPPMTTVTLNTVEYKDHPRPTLQINHLIIPLGSHNSKITEFAKIIFTKERLMKFWYNTVGIDEIFEWFYPGRDWFNEREVTKRFRKKFQNDIYQRFRRLNEKISPYLDNKKLFESVGKEYSFNSQLHVVKGLDRK